MSTPTLCSPAITSELAVTPSVQQQELIRQCVAGLSRSPKQLPSKFFYDDRGSELFEQICQQPEYYPTRTELGILREHVRTMAQAMGQRVMVIEPGSGSGVKTRLLLEALDERNALAGYVPVEISAAALQQSVQRIAAERPTLAIHPVCADYTLGFELPELEADARPVVFFPGSTLGNFQPQQARAFLQRLATIVGPGGGLLIGVDLLKHREQLEPAYDDAAGVTAAFNLNLLERLNRQAHADFQLEKFTHRAWFNQHRSRIEMHLVSQQAQAVRLGGHTFTFEPGEPIVTEYSYKYTLDGFAAVATGPFDVEQVWMDEQRWFSVQWLRARG